jgi:mRNA interferase RelE/StbE
VYEVYLERSAESDLKRLTPSIFQRIVSPIKALAGNPRPSGCKKITGSSNDWRIRIGDYRVIYEIDDKAMIVRIMRVRHRREVYQRQ